MHNRPERASYQIGYDIGINIGLNNSVKAIIMKFKIIIPVFLFILQYLWVVMFFLLSVLSWLLITSFKIVGLPRLVRLENANQSEANSAIAV